MPVTKAVYHRVKPHGFPGVTTCYNTSNCGIKYHPAISLSSFGFQNSKPEEIGAMPFIRDVLPHLGSIVHKIEHFFAGSNCGFCQPCDVAKTMMSLEWNLLSLIMLKLFKHIQTQSRDPGVSSSLQLEVLNQFCSVHGLCVLPLEVSPAWNNCAQNWMLFDLQFFDLRVSWRLGIGQRAGPRVSILRQKNRLSSLAVDFFQFLTNALSLAGHLANLTKSFRCKWPAGLGSARCRFP